MKLVTANRLIDGEVVFWKAGAWVEGFGDAELFDESREAEVEAVVATGQGPGRPRSSIPIRSTWPWLTAAWPRSATRERIRPCGPTSNPPTASRPSAAR